MIVPPWPPISGTTQVAAVIGSPVRHSLSPTLHNAAFAASGLDWRLVAFDVAPGRGADAVAAMRALGLAGLAVTMPHKADVAAAVDEVDPAAAALRSVNTVVLRDDGSTYGVSTDGPGFVDSLISSGVRVAGARFVVIGAGGAARSIVDTLGRVGAADIAILNRTADRVGQVAALAAAARPGSIVDVEDADVVVNTTSVGMAGTGSGSTSDVPIDVRALRPSSTVVDIVYHPRRTALLAAADRIGAATVDGLGMLVHQAIRQQELWTGRRPDPAVLLRTAELALVDRS